MPRRPRWRSRQQALRRRLRTERIVQAAGDPANKTVPEIAKAAGVSAHEAYRVLRLPHVQSMVTEALERQGLTPDAIVRPYLDALNAWVVVRSSETMDARETAVPDHEQRCRAADRIIQLYGLRGGRDAEDVPLARGDVVQIQVQFVAPPGTPAPPGVQFIESDRH